LAVDTIAGLKAKMPLSTAAGTSVADLWDLIDTLEDRTSQSIITTAVNYGVSLADNRRKILVNSTGTVTITLPNTTPAGFELTVIQMGTGAAVLAVTGGTLLSRDNHTRTAGQYAISFLVCTANAGTTPQVVLGGDTAP
jgi:hypothetical protein